MEITQEQREQDIETLGLRIEDDTEWTERLLEHALCVVGGLADEEGKWATQHAAFYAGELDGFIGEKCLAEQDGCEERQDRIGSSASYVFHVLRNWISELPIDKSAVSNLSEQIVAAFKAVRSIERYKTYDGGNDEGLTCAEFSEALLNDLPESVQAALEEGVFAKNDNV